MKENESDLKNMSSITKNMSSSTWEEKAEASGRDERYSVNKGTRPPMSSRVWSLEGGRELHSSDRLVELVLKNSKEVVAFMIPFSYVFVYSLVICLNPQHQLGTVYQRKLIVLTKKVRVIVSCL